MMIKIIKTSYLATALVFIFSIANAEISFEKIDSIKILNGSFLIQGKDKIVLDKKKTKSNLFSYTLGIDIGPTDEEGKYIKEVDGKKYMEVGKALNTKIAVDVGDIVRVMVDEVKRTGDRYTLFSAKVIEIPEVTMPDKVVTLEFLSQDSKWSLNFDVSALEK